MCSCREGYKTVDHILWSCILYQAERMQLKSHLLGGDLSMCSRDMVALRQWSNNMGCVSLLVSIGFHV
jgi:hypothetical protein